MRIAFQGASGAYSEAAALKAWPEAEVIACDRFEEVFAAVAGGRVSHGILPVENSIGGSIHVNYDLLLQHDLPIVAETELAVVHNLLALPGTTIAQIRRVFSHPQALAQCEQYLRTLAGVEIVATYDTAGSARLIREGSLTDTAAIASTRAAELFGLEILQAGIEDFADNITRFILIARDQKPLGERRQDLDCVRPAQRTWRALQGAQRVRAARHRSDQARVTAGPRAALGYVFYADLGAGRSDVRCGRAIIHLAEFARWVRTLGSYPRWTGGRGSAPKAVPQSSSEATTTS